MEANRLGNERVDGRSGSGRRGEQVRSSEVIPRDRHPELAIEVFAAEHGETIEIVRLTVERGRVLVSVRLPQPILADAKRLRGRQDAPVEQAEVRLELGRESHGPGTNGSDLSQEPKRDLTLRDVVQEAERDAGACLRCGVGGGLATTIGANAPVRTNAAHAPSSRLNRPIATPPALNLARRGCRRQEMS